MKKVARSKDPQKQALIWVEHWVTEWEKAWASSPEGPTKAAHLAFIASCLNSSLEDLKALVDA